MSESYFLSPRGVSAFRRASGEWEKCSGNLKMLPEIGRMDKNNGKLKMIEGQHKIFSGQQR